MGTRRRLTAAVAAVLMVAFAAKAQQQPKVRALTEQELADMMLGSSIQASRSSDTAASVRRLKDALASGKKFTMISVEDLPDDWTTITDAGAGGGGAWQYVIDRTKQQKLPTVPNTTVVSAGVLSKYLGKKFNAVIRGEADGDTINALLLASDLGVPIVDACLSGRARPETQQQIPTVNGIAASPAAYVTRWGDTIILEKAVDDYRVEDIVRAIAVASGGGTSGVMNAMSAADVKRGVLRGNLTQAIELGRTVRESVQAGKDPIEAILKMVHGYRLFHGVVIEDDSKGDRGFTWSDVTLTGIGEDAGHTYRVYVKNENVVTWLDGKPDATAPDFIQDLDSTTGDAHVGPTLGAYRVGAEIVMIGWPADPQWRKPAGIELFGPRHFGFDFDYVPIEQLIERRKANK
jgi:uncharacterized protein